MVALNKKWNKIANLFYRLSWKKLVWKQTKRRESGRQEMPFIFKLMLQFSEMSPSILKSWWYRADYKLLWQSFFYFIDTKGDKEMDVECCLSSPSASEHLFWVFFFSVYLHILLIKSLKIHQKKRPRQITRRAFCHQPCFGKFLRARRAATPLPPSTVFATHASLVLLTLTAPRSGCRSCRRACSCPWPSSSCSTWPTTHSRRPASPAPKSPARFSFDWLIEFKIIRYLLNDWKIYEQSICDRLIDWSI